QQNRISIWNNYKSRLNKWAIDNEVRLPFAPINTTNNAHMFYLICKDAEQRSNLINRLKKNKISAVFHYLSLHNSPFYTEKHDGRALPNSDFYSDCLVRLPLFYELSDDELQSVVDVIMDTNE